MKSETKRSANKRQFSPKRQYSPRRHSDHHHPHHSRRGGHGGGGDRGYRSSFGGRGGFRGGFRDRGNSFRDSGGRPGFDRDFDRRDFNRDRDFAERRHRENEIRREKEFYDLEKERLEVEKLKLKREREELEKLSSEMSSDRSFNDHKRQKTFDNFSSGDSRRFDDFR